MINYQPDDINKLNERIKNCKKCSLYREGAKPICGEGSLKAPFFFVTYSPGKDEAGIGKILSGTLGKCLNQLLSRTGIGIKDVYASSLIKCYLPEGYNLTDDEVKICSDYLDEEIRIINPRVIIPLGNYATLYMFRRYKGDNGIKVSFSEGCGKLFWREGIKLFPLEYPSSMPAGCLKNGKVAEDYKKLSVLSRRCKWFNVCPMKYFFEDGRIEQKWIELYCNGYWESCVRYKMEEKGIYHPDWMLPDGSLSENLK